MTRTREIILKVALLSPIIGASFWYGYFMTAKVDRGIYQLDRAISATLEITLILSFVVCCSLWAFAKLSAPKLHYFKQAIFESLSSVLFMLIYCFSVLIWRMTFGNIIGGNFEFGPLVSGPNSIFLSEYRFFNYLIVVVPIVALSVLLISVALNLFGVTSSPDNMAAKK